MQKGTFKEWHSNSVYGSWGQLQSSLFRQQMPGSVLNTLLHFGGLHETICCKSDTSCLEVEGAAWSPACQQQALTNKGLDFFSPSAIQKIYEGIVKGSIIIFDKSKEFLLQSVPNKVVCEIFRFLGGVKFGVSDSLKWYRVFCIISENQLSPKKNIMD
jgi:hypothetical protein